MTARVIEERGHELTLEVNRWVSRRCLEELGRDRPFQSVTSDLTATDWIFVSERSRSQSRHDHLFGLMLVFVTYRRQKSLMRAIKV